VNGGGEIPALPARVHESDSVTTIEKFDSTFYEGVVDVR
jgi:hypothetical protein